MVKIQNARQLKPPQISWEAFLERECPGVWGNDILTMRRGAIVSSFFVCCPPYLPASALVSLGFGLGSSQGRYESAAPAAARELHHAPTELGSD